MMDFEGNADPALTTEMHAIASAAKPAASWLARDAIQTVRFQLEFIFYFKIKFNYQAREACGGHGYMAVNRIGLLREENDPNLTYEGENNVFST